MDVGKHYSSSADSRQKKAAARLGITEDALREIEIKVYEDLKRSAFAIANGSAFDANCPPNPHPLFAGSQLAVREIKDDKRTAELDQSGPLARDCDAMKREMARAIGVSLLNPYSKAAIDYAETLAQRIADQKREINCDAIADQAIEYCSSLAQWENSRRWFVRAFYEGGFEEGEATASIQDEFAESLSHWSDGEWQVSTRDDPKRGFVFTVSLPNPASSLREVLQDKIMPMVRLAPKPKAVSRVPSKKTNDRVRAVADLAERLESPMSQMPKSKRALDRSGFASLLKSAGITNPDEIELARTSNTPRSAATKILSRKHGWNRRTLQNTVSREKAPKA